MIQPPLVLRDFVNHLASSDQFSRNAHLLASAPIDTLYVDQYYSFSKSIGDIFEL